MTEPAFDVEAVMRKHGFALGVWPVGGILSEEYAEQWMGRLNGAFYFVLPQDARRFAHQLLTRN